MYKLTFNELGKNKEAIFKGVPTMIDIQEKLNVAITPDTYENLVSEGQARTMFALYKLTPVPTIKQLDEAWKDFLSVAIYQDLRFGQYFYNEYNFEINNSYNIERPYLAYQVLYEALVTTLDDVLQEQQ